MRVLLAAILCLALPVAATAHRKPTKSEKAKLTQAAKRSKQTRYLDCLSVDHARISTKGPWAGASIRNCDNKNDVIFGLFSRSDSSRWRLRRTGNGSVGCDIAPRKVQRDLDLGCF